MKNERKEFEGILEAIDGMCEDALQSNDKRYWEQIHIKAHIHLNIENHIASYLYYDFIEGERPTNKQLNEVQGIAEHILRTATSLVKTFDTITPTRGIIDIVKLLMRIRDNINKEFVNLSSFVQDSPPRQGEERQYDARLLAYYRNDKKVCELFYNELAKTKPLTPKAVKDAFVRFNPDIKKLYVGELANFLQEISKVKISRANMASIVKWCEGKGIPIYKNPNKSHKKKEC